MNKTIKNINHAGNRSELSNVSRLIPLVLEMGSLLKELKSSDSADYATKVNKKSGFVNSLMSATAYGQENEYKRLLELETLISGKLSITDLDGAKGLKASVVDSIKESFTTYYSDEEMRAKKILEKVIDNYNSLPQQYRSQVALNNLTGELSYKPFSDLRH